MHDVPDEKRLKPAWQTVFDLIGIPSQNDSHTDS